MTEPSTTVTRSSVMTWTVAIDGTDKGNVHKFLRRGSPLFCHDLWVARGAHFPTLKAAVDDLVRRAA